MVYGIWYMEGLVFCSNKSLNNIFNLTDGYERIT